MPALDLLEHGVEIREGVLSERDIRSVISDISLDSETLRSSGIRNLEKKFASIARLAADRAVLGIARQLLRGTPRLVRALFFDKTPRSRVRVPSIGWHYYGRQASWILRSPW